MLGEPNRSANWEDSTFKEMCHIHEEIIYYQNLVAQAEASLQILTEQKQQVESWHKTYREILRAKNPREKTAERLIIDELCKRMSNYLAQGEFSQESSLTQGDQAFANWCYQVQSALMGGSLDLNSVKPFKGVIGELESQIRKLKNVINSHRNKLKKLVELQKQLERG